MQKKKISMGILVIGIILLSIEIGLNIKSQELRYSTYFSGEDDDSIRSIAIGDNDDVFIAGYTESVNFANLPTTENSRLRSFLMKLDKSGKLESSTFIGGSYYDELSQIALGPNGSVYLCGMTFSEDFPIQNAIDTNQLGIDGFIIKLNDDWTINYSTFLGGSDFDRVSSIVVDADGTCYFAGTTRSTDFPILNAFDEICSDLEGFIGKLNPDGSLNFSTYIGGSGKENKFFIDIDENASIYTTFETWDSSIKTSINILKLNATGNLVYNQSFGGSNVEFIGDMAVSENGTVYITGDTSSDDFPLVNPIFSQKNGYLDIFLSKLDPNGNLIFSTYLGGSREDHGRGICIDNSGAVYITGYTLSPDFPTKNAYRSDFGWDDDYKPEGDPSNFTTYYVAMSSILVKIDQDNKIEYSTFIQGNGRVIGWRVAVSQNNDDVYVVGYTESSDFPLKKPLFHYEAKFDAFLVKFSNPDQNTISHYAIYLGIVDLIMIIGVGLLLKSMLTPKNDRDQSIVFLI